MRGKILETNEGGGLISGEDSQRYSFNKKDEKNSEIFKVGQTVDFLVDGDGFAKDIYPIEKEKKGFIEEAGNSDGSIMAAVGSGVSLLGAIPYVGIFFSIVGIVLELVGVKKLSNAVNNPSIFSNMLWGLILAYISSVILLAGAFFGIVGGGMPIIVVGAVVFLILAISSAIKTFRAYRDLGVEYNVSIFKTSAWLFVIGVITMPIVIGVLFMLAHQICNIIGYLSIKKSREAQL